MPEHEQVVLSDQELQLIQEVQATLGFDTTEQTIEYLLSERLRTCLLTIAGREIEKQHRRY